MSEGGKNHVDDVLKHENEQLSPNDLNESNLIKENGLSDGDTHSNYSHDELVQMVVELNFRNEYMKSQYEGLQNHLLDSGDRKSVV